VTLLLRLSFCLLALSVVLAPSVQAQSRNVSFESAAAQQMALTSELDKETYTLQDSVSF